MAGPTPVSALIHAATMVTAGVYMVTRLHFLFDHAPTALTVIAWIGALTALVAATIAVAQQDIKKVLAYSTISQLGYMFLGLGVGVSGAALFHVVTHAFFKGLLFLGAGSVIHGCTASRTCRRWAGLRRHMPGTYWTMLVGTLAIAGVPPLSGFFSKDEIIWGAFSGPHAQPVLGVLGYVVAFLTAFYMGRMFFLTFSARSASTITTCTRTSRRRACSSRWSCWRSSRPSAARSTSPARCTRSSACTARKRRRRSACSCSRRGSRWAASASPGTATYASRRCRSSRRTIRRALRVPAGQVAGRRALRRRRPSARCSRSRRLGARVFDPYGRRRHRERHRIGGRRGLEHVGRRLQTGNLQHYALSFLAGALVLLGYYVVR
jgi:hypothetical protein